MTTKQFDCPQCAAQLEYDASKGAPVCPYCGFVSEVETTFEQKIEAVTELDYFEYLAKHNEGNDESETEETLTVKCEGCYAESTVEAGQMSSECPFCGNNIVTQSKSRRLLKPRAILPFTIDAKSGHEKWKTWINGLWFAPNKLKQTVKYADKLQGVYIPYWTYDASTETYYDGERGDTRYEKINGKKVPKIKWTHVSGDVTVDFDDILIVASHGVPHKYANRLDPWELEELVPYDDQYLSGFKAEAYQIDLQKGYEEARTIMDNYIDRTIRKDIGGDHQRIHSKDTSYENVTFKHILLPIWISAYQFNDKVYKFLVNGQTGKVQGERPWSWVKITLLILTLVAIAAATIIISRYSRHR
ncbi:MAG: zinc ribbon domain-containing protein [Deltaproteobacteria bacterium]|nr:zinc ribbon domain-containing protein [Deltaproteobacteria bacterium]